NISNPHLVQTNAGAGIKAGSGSYHYGFAVVVKFFQKPLCKSIAVFYWKLHDAIKCTFRLANLHAGNGFQSSDQCISAVLIFGNYFVKIALWGLQSCFTRNLRKSWRT